MDGAFSACDKLKWNRFEACLGDLYGVNIKIQNTGGIGKYGACTRCGKVCCTEDHGFDGTEVKIVSAVSVCSIQVVMVSSCSCNKRAS